MRLFFIYNKSYETFLFIIKAIKSILLVGQKRKF